MRPLGKVPKGDISAGLKKRQQHTPPSPWPHPSGEHTHFAISSISTKLRIVFGFALALNAQGTIS